MARRLAPWLHPSLPLLLVAASACVPADPGSDGDDTDPADPGDVVPTCTDDPSCDDGNPCNGTETCGDDGTCLPGTAVSCDDPGATCVVEDGGAVCAILCALPRAPVLEVLRQDETLTFTGPSGIETAVIDTDDAVDDAIWSASATVVVDRALGLTRVLARSADPSCDEDERFDHVYDVQPGYPGAAGTDTTRALAHDDPAFVAWATGHPTVVYGDAVDAPWKAPDDALGPATVPATVVSLGRGGTITLTFDAPITDGPGADFAVFENSFSDDFLELAWVEVSSDGNTFVRFDSAAYTPSEIGAFGTSDPADLHGLAGVYRAGFGTPFDLSLLRHAEPVRTGVVDLSAITHVRLVDVVGDGSDRDSFDRPIHDPFPTTGSAGFDLDAVGVIHEAAE